MGMSTNVITSIINAIPTLVLAIVTVVMSNRLVVYRISQLETKVEKHNNVTERTALLEQKMDAAFERIDEMKDEIKSK